MLPCFSYALYPALNRFSTLLHCEKIGLGLFLVSWHFDRGAIQMRIDAGGHPHILCRSRFLVLTAANSGVGSRI